MKSANSKYNKAHLRLTGSNDYWWDIIMGALITAVLMISIGGSILKIMNLQNLLYPYAIVCIILVVYYQWRDDNLIAIPTGLSKAKNFDIVTTSLDRLDWHYYKNSTSVDLAFNKYMLKFLNPTIIPASNSIYFNFQYHSTTRTGRLPFFLGISTYLKWKFEKALRKTMEQANN